MYCNIFAKDCVHATRIQHCSGNNEYETDFKLHNAHILIHGYAEFTRSQVQILVKNVLLLIIRAASKERQIMALTISTSSNLIYYTLFFLTPLLKRAQLM